MSSGQSPPRAETERQAASTHTEVLASGVCRVLLGAVGPVGWGNWLGKAGIDRHSIRLFVFSGVGS